MNDIYILVLHLDTGVETPEFARYVNRFGKSLDDISVRQMDADAVRVRVAVVDVDGIRALRDGRDAEPFSENVGRDKQAALGINIVKILARHACFTPFPQLFRQISALWAAAPL